MFLVLCGLLRGLTLCILLKAFNNKYFHLSEIKTILIISKPFKQHDIIKEARETLLETYKKMKSK